MNETRKTKFSDYAIQYYYDYYSLKLKYYQEAKCKKVMESESIFFHTTLFSKKITGKVSLYFTGNFESNSCNDHYDDDTIHGSITFIL